MVPYLVCKLPEPVRLQQQRGVEEEEEEEQEIKGERKEERKAETKPNMRYVGGVMQNKEEGRLENVEMEN